METPGAPPRQLSYAEYQGIQEDNNLRALSIGCLAYGILMMGMLAIQVLLTRQMMAMIMNPRMFGNQPQAQMPPGFESMMQTVLAITYVIIGITALLSLFAAKCIHDRKNWVWVMIAAGAACINVPIGTVLAVFIFILLTKPTVRAKFTS